MSDPVTALRAYLLTVSDVTDECGTRVYYNNLPQGATLPAVVLELTASEVADRHLVATGTLYNSQVSAHCYAGTHAAAVTLGDAVYAAIEFQSGTWGGVAVKHATVENTHDVVDWPRDGSDVVRHVRSVMNSVWHA